MPDRALRTFTTGALELIRDLAGRGEDMNRIRGALRSQEGVWFRDAEIIAGGAMFGLEIVPVSTGAEPSVPVPHVTMAPKRVPDRVRLVAAGTYPANRFSMIQGRCR